MTDLQAAMTLDDIANNIPKTEFKEIKKKLNIISDELGRLYEIERKYNKIPEEIISLKVSEDSAKASFAGEIANMVLDHVVEILGVTNDWDKTKR